MKKFLFTTALAAGFLCSCSSDDAPVAASQQPSAAQEGLVPVELSVGSPVSVSKKGKGAIGTTDGSLNWNGETLYLFMMQRSDAANGLDWTPTTWSFTPTVASLPENHGGAEQTMTNFNNTPVIAPTEAASGLLSWGTTDNTPKYYPSNSVAYHDFFAYYIDDATTTGVTDAQIEIQAADEGAGTPAVMQKVKKVDFEIDGSQDLMSGWASGTGFNQKTAREGTVPSITMKHLLTRFKFNVVAGKGSSDGLSITRIAIKSKATGNMIVAYDLGDEKVAPQELIEFSGVEKELALAGLDKNNAIELATFNNESGSINYAPVDNSLMVQPGLTEYEMLIDVLQEYKTQEPIVITPDPEAPENTITGKYEGQVTKTYTIKMADVLSGESTLGEGAKAAAGTSYNVNIQVFGLNEIKVEASLTPWVDGGDVDAVEQ